MFLWYILIDDILNIVDYYWNIPISTDNLIRIHNILVEITLFIVLILYVKDNKITVRKIINDIDCGNSNITEDEAMEMIKVIKSYTDKTQRLSKYQACQKLNVSRATFDNLVREGVIPRGEKVIGFKELFWEEKTLDNVIKGRRNDNKERH